MVDRLEYIDEAGPALTFEKLKEVIDTMLAKKPDDLYVGEFGRMEIVVDERPKPLNESKYIPRTKRSR